jgi:hypothetical protein
MTGTARRSEIRLLRDKNQLIKHRFRVNIEFLGTLGMAVYFPVDRPGGGQLPGGFKDC